MKTILDTNVFISGVFFKGPPHQILKAWRESRIRLLISGDKHLLRVSGYMGIKVLRPRKFVDEYLVKS